MMKAPRGTHGLGSLIVLIILKAGGGNVQLSQLCFLETLENMQKIIRLKGKKTEEKSQNIIVFFTQKT